MSDFETITISNSSSTPTIMTYDGFITLVCEKGEGQGNGQFKIFINEQDLTYLFASEESRYGYSLQFAIKKGDTVYIPLNRYISKTLVRYYKNRDYSNR